MNEVRNKRTTKTSKREREREMVLLISTIIAC